MTIVNIMLLCELSCNRIKVQENDEREWTGGFSWIYGHKRYTNKCEMLLWQPGTKLQPENKWW